MDFFGISLIAMSTGIVAALGYVVVFCDPPPTRHARRAKWRRGSCRRAIMA